MKKKINLKSHNYPEPERHQRVFGSRGAFSPLAEMLIAPSQCGPDEMVVAARWWARAPIG